MTLEEFIRELRKQPLQEIHRWSEEDAKNKAVVRILEKLGWDIQDMKFEHGVGIKRKKNRADIRLLAGKRSVIVECKKPKVDLDGEVDQLFSYAVLERSRLAVLTNGMRWDLYLPFADAKNRRVASIDLQSQNEPGDLSAELTRFLEHSAVRSGKAESAAKVHLKEQKRGARIHNELLSIWNRWLAKPPDALINLIAKEVHGRIGHAPEHRQVRQFLTQYGNLMPAPVSSKPVTSQLGNKKQKKARGKKPICAFVLWGQRTEVESWAMLLFEVAIKIYRKHGNDFARATERVNWIARSDSGMRYPRQIPGSPYYVNTHGGAPGLENRSRMLLEFFGHSRDDLIIE